jgi:hypothetical protein
MQVPSFRVDAFTSTVFTGNPSLMCPFRRVLVTIGTAVLWEIGDGIWLVSFMAMISVIST